ncbi:MAG: purine-nucleoside phosphorylase [Psychroflexus sp.]|nr:purine-nucleoside phosphorylase [Psychroflexus sp.]MDR9448132.1 purine-nucleoside phosphorylase [Psychroflexus sp.]
MSLHIAARKGEIAETVLLPGDPKRAEWIAQTFLKNPVCYNEVRGMLGYTGTYKGQLISVQGSGMGIPSLSIYVHELVHDYGVKNIIRVGSAGSMQQDIQLNDIVIAMSASTDSAINKSLIPYGDFAPSADFKLLENAVAAARNLKQRLQVGQVLSSDIFYSNPPDNWQKWAAHNCLCVEMETAGLYSLASRFNLNALSVLTISDSLITGQSLSSESREKQLSAMVDIAINAVVR